MNVTAVKIRLQSEFMRRLASMAEERSERPDSWMDYEEEQMYSLVNAFRAAAGLPQIDRQVVARANTSASGHIDYGSKFSLYCAEIALGIGPFMS